MRERRMTECFICLDDTPPLLTKLCLCTDRAIHPACQRALVAKAPKADATLAAVCGACKQEYRNVSRHVVHRTNRLAYILLLCSVMSLVSLGGGIAELASYTLLSDREKYPYVWMISLGVLLLVVGVFAGGFVAIHLLLPLWQGHPLQTLLCDTRLEVRIHNL